MKNHCAMCTNGHLFIALRTFHLYGNETMRSPGLFACLSCPAPTIGGGEESPESREVFAGTSLRALFQGRKRKKGGPCERDVQCHRQNSHPGEEYTFVRKSMIAVFVLESTGNLLGK